MKYQKINLKTFNNLFLLCFLSLLISHARAEYKPSVTVEKSVDTYQVKKDGTYTLISENVHLIETQDGIDDAEQDISYNSSFETVEIVSAYTLQPDGRKIKVPKDGIRTTIDQRSSGESKFSDTKHKVIIFPQVKIGSRLCYTYKHLAHKVKFKNQFLLSNYYSPHYRWGDIRVNIHISDQLPLNVETDGVSGGWVSHSKGQNHYQFHYTQENYVPVQKDEVFIMDYAPHFIASSFNSHIEVGQYYAMQEAPKVMVTPKVQKLADEITLGIDNQRDQVRAIYHWVRDNIRYIAVFLKDGGIVPHSADTILNNHYGDCKDHAALLKSLLMAKGIESSTALVNSGKAFTLPKYPLINPQNHAITYIPSLDLYLDSTNPLVPFGVIPSEIVDKPTILTSLNKMGRTPKMTKEDNTAVSHIYMKINEDGTINGTTTSNFYGVYEDAVRYTYLYKASRDEQQVVRDELAENNESGTGKITTTNPKDTTTQFTVTTEYHLDEKSNFPGPAAMTIPIGLSPNHVADSFSIKPEKVRYVPYICTPGIAKEIYEISFPEKTKITRIPENVYFEKLKMKYVATYKLEGNKLLVTREVVDDHDGNICQPDEVTGELEIFKVIKKDLRNQVFYE